MDSRDLGMLWNLRDSIQQLPLQPKKKKKVGRGQVLYPPHFSFGFYMAHPMPLAGVYKLVWFGPYTRFALFSFSLCALVAFHLSYHSYLSFIFCCSRLPMFHLYIYNHVTIYHTCIHAFLSWTTSTYHIHINSYPQSRLGYRCFNTLYHLFLFLFPCPHLYYPYHSMHCSIIHAFPDNLYYSIHACFLEQLYITIYILRFGLAIQAGFVIAMHG